MGGDVSSLIRPIPPSLGVFSARFNGAVLSLLHADSAVVECVEQAVAKYWTPGFDPVEPLLKKVSHEIKLREFKSETTFWEDPLAMVTCCALISSLAEIGYRLVSAPDIFMTLDDAELLFNKCDRRVKLRHVCCVRIMNTNLVQSCLAPEPVMAAVEEFANKFNIIDARSGDKKWYQTMTMEGKPFKPTSNKDRAIVVQRITDLFSAMNKLGFALLSTASLDGQQDAWFFHKPDHAPPANTEFSAFMLTSTDELIAVGCEPRMIQTIGHTIQKNWHKGMQTKEEHRDFVEFQFNGKPWRSPSFSSSEIPLARLWMIDLLAGLAKSGIILTCATDISEEEDDKSLFIFQTSLPIRPKFLAVEPVGLKELYCMDVPDDVVKALAKVFGTLLGKDNFDVKPPKDRSRTIKLRGEPWSPKSNTDALLARHLVIILIAALKAEGWTAVAAADIQGDVRQAESHEESRVGKRHRKKAGIKEMKSADTHTLIFMKDEERRH